MSDQPQRWRQEDIEERDARIKELEAKVEAQAADIFALLSRIEELNQEAA